MSRHSRSSPQLAHLFLQFMKFGCFTFGGGWSILSQMQKTYVEEEGILTNELLLDITSIGKSIPGAMICNIALLFGTHVAGLPGGLICLLGLSIPPFAVLCTVTYFYDLLLDNLWFYAAMQGVRMAVVPMIAAAVLKMCRGERICPPTVLLARDVGIPVLIVDSALAGLLAESHAEGPRIFLRSRLLLQEGNGAGTEYSH